MSRFTPRLRELSERLSLPQAARARILLEVSGDLEALFRRYVEKGLSEADAEREALSRIDLSDEALEELCRVHGGWFRRFVETLAHRAGPTWERLLLIGLAVAALVLSGVLLQAVPMSKAAGVGFIPVAGVTLAALSMAAWKVWELFLVRDHRPARLRFGLDALVGLSVLQVFLAFGALWVSAVHVFRSTTTAPAQAGLATMGWLEGSLALLVLSLSLAIVVGLVWFFLLTRVVSIEQREATALLEAWGTEG